jgi:Cellulase (glycosyl hydrolase family 5)
MSRRKLHMKVALAATVLCISAVLLGTASAAQARTILKGTADGALTRKGATNTTATVAFLANKLHTQMLRFDLRWNRLEPQRGVYDQTYLDQLAQTIHAAAGDGLKVIITMYDTPKWASDTTLWKYVPPGYHAGVYHSIYPPAPNRLADYQALAEKLATTFKGDVLGYECRNEPNAWFSLYPQRLASDPDYGVRRYAEMLTAFSKGIRAGDPNALVIAGSTSPHGNNDDLETSPQRFATVLKTLVPLSVFDVYSHHPYTVGGTANIAPEDMPRDPAHAVSLGNISTLLKIFPSKPFYISEYGYYTEYRTAMGIYVNQVTQAKYVPRAYAYAARFPQIKALIWYPYQDSGPADPPPNNNGCYSGLVTTTGAFKLSWFAFAGDNKITLKAAVVGTSRRLSGRLTTSVGGLRDKALLLYRKTAGHPWRVVKNLTTGSGGSYHATLKVSGRTFFRVAWLGVVRSPTLTVK